MKDTTWGRYFDNLLMRSVAACFVILISTVATAAVLVVLLTLGMPEGPSALTALLAGVVVAVAAGIAQYRIVGPLPTLTDILASRGTLTRSGDSLRQALTRRLPLAPTLMSEVFLGGMGGSRWCTFRPGAEALAYGSTPGCEVEIGGSLGMNFEGFDPRAPLLVKILGPDEYGTERELPPRRGGGHFWDWLAMPGLPPGTYTVEAHQGQTTVSWTVPVRRPAEPRVSVFPSFAPPGTTFVIALAGFKPKLLVPIRLHRAAGEREVIIDADRDRYGLMGVFDYVATLRPVQVDEHGEAIYRLRTDPNEPDMNYVVETEPRPTYAAAVLDRMFHIAANSEPDEEFARG